MYHPFIDDPEHLRLLAGQRYVVLRASDQVRAAYLAIQSLVKDSLAGLNVSYPAEPHVTLLGLGAGTGLDAVRGLVTEWASDVAPLHLEIERLSVFSPPFQIVIVEIRKTQDLFGAMSRLRERAQQRGLADLAKITPSDWVFHLSVAYCSSLNATSWDAASRFADGLVVPVAQCVTSEVEIVAFDDEQESSGGIVPLTGAASNVGDQEAV